MSFAGRSWLWMASLDMLNLQDLEPLHDDGIYRARSNHSKFTQKLKSERCTFFSHPSRIRLRFLQPPTLLPSVNDDDGCGEAAVITSGENNYAYDGFDGNDCCDKDDAHGDGLDKSSCCTSSSDNDHDKEVSVRYWGEEHVQSV